MIEDAYQSDKSLLRLIHGFFQRDTYTIKLSPKDDMKQINNKTKFERTIRRNPTGTGTTNSYKRKRENSDSSSDIEVEIIPPLKKQVLPSSNAFSKLMKPQTPVDHISPLKKSGELPKEKTKEEKEGVWKDALLAYINNPDKYKEEIYYQNDKVIVIKDKYPKATVHFLVIPKRIIPNYSRLDLASLSLLRQIRNVGVELIENLTEENKGLTFRMGFHAIPSMTQLHMHVISEDFISPWLKTKKHWNSFTTDFFIPADDFIKRLERDEKLEFDKTEYNAFLKLPLKCFKSGKVFPTMPKLKEYLEFSKIGRIVGK